MGSDINQIKQDLQTVKDKNHEQEINCLCLCPNLANGYYSSFITMQNEIISCGCDGSITVWRYCDVVLFILVYL